MRLALRISTTPRRIRAKILGAFETSRNDEDEGERVRQMTSYWSARVPTGVELAASLAQMVKVTLRDQLSPH